MVSHKIMTDKVRVEQKGRESEIDETTALLIRLKQTGDKNRGKDMGVDWGFAGQIGGVGFGMVFALLIILAVVIWLTGLVVTKTSTGKAETGDKKEGNQKLAQEIIEVPLTGKITSVEVKVGDKVKEGDVICFIESMKMENPILDPVDGTIVQMNVTPEQIVKPGETIAIIEY